MRETLFNWLAPIVAGARCLDLFAGTGALGLEALSRGAQETLFVEHDRRLAAAIEANLCSLGTDAGQVICGDGTTALARDLGSGFDIVFLDPPFAGDLMTPVLEKLVSHLRPGHRVYLEFPAAGTPVLPPGWRLLRDKRAGQVGYRLATFESDRQDTGP